MAPFALTFRAPPGWQPELKAGGFALGKPGATAAIVGMGGVYPNGADLPQGAMALMRDMTQGLQPMGQPRTSRSGDVDRLHLQLVGYGQDGTPLDLVLTCAHHASGQGAMAFGFAPRGTVPDLARAVEMVGESFEMGELRPDEEAMSALAGTWRAEPFQGNRDHGGGRGFTQSVTTLDLNPDGTFVHATRSSVSVSVPGASGLSDGRTADAGRWFVVEDHLVLATPDKGCLTQPLRAEGGRLWVGQEGYVRADGAPVRFAPRGPPQAAQGAPPAQVPTPPHAAPPQPSHPSQGQPAQGSVATRLAPWPVTFQAPEGWLVHLTPLGAAMGTQGGEVLTLLHAGVYHDAWQLFRLVAKSLEGRIQSMQPLGGVRSGTVAGRLAHALSYHGILMDGQPLGIEAAVALDPSGLGAIVICGGPMGRQREMADTAQRVLGMLAFGPLQVDPQQMRPFVGRWTRYKGSSSGYSSSPSRSSTSAFSWYEFREDGTWVYHSESSVSATVPGLSGFSASQDGNQGRWFVLEGKLVLISEANGCDVVDADLQGQQLRIGDATFVR